MINAWKYVKKGLDYVSDRMISFGKYPPVDPVDNPFSEKDKIIQGYDGDRIKKVVEEVRIETDGSDVAEKAKVHVPKIVKYLTEIFAEEAGIIVNPKKVKIRSMKRPQYVLKDGFLARVLGQYDVRTGWLSLDPALPDPVYLQTTQHLLTHENFKYMLFGVLAHELGHDYQVKTGVAPKLVHDYGPERGVDIVEAQVRDVTDSVIDRLVAQSRRAANMN